LKQRLQNGKRIGSFEAAVAAGVAGRIALRSLYDAIHQTPSNASYETNETSMASLKRSPDFSDNISNDGTITVTSPPPEAGREIPEHLA
jgi:hypothetical protein